MRRSRFGRPFAVALLTMSAALSLPTASAVAAEARRRPRPVATGSQRLPGPVVRRPVRHDLSPRLDEIARGFTPPTGTGVREIEVPETVANNFAAESAAALPDPVVQDWKGEQLIPNPQFSFEGLSNADNVATVGGTVTPPDTNGDVGPNHYVQTVNLIFAIYDRAGNRLLGPLPNNALWSGFGGDCQNRNNGDPIALYDHLADRWLLSQFTTASPYHQCIAISQTADPTGAWYRYDFLIPSGRFNDYPKFGVWPDAYYMSAGSRGIPGPQTDVFAFERNAMLTGASARMVTFVTDASLGYVAPMPADLDGPLPPAGAPNPFVGVKQSSPQALYVFRFHVDWVNTANSSFGLGGLPNSTLSSVAPFTVICPSTRNCVPQPDTTVGLDALAGRYVMYRAQYRNFGSHETIVFNQTVDAGASRAGVRWYEIRDPGGAPFIHQQGTYAPADGIHRWMGSAAMDQQGNLAIGYSAASATVYPSIYYAGRLASDPPGQLAQGEAVIVAGAGSQTSTGNRWGDYSMLAVDPTDDCTFWYTTEYYAATSTNLWQTRIGRFRFTECGTPDFTVSAGPVTITMPPGAGAVIPAMVRSLNGFNSPVDLSCLSVAPSGISCAFGSGSVTPLPNGTVTTPLTLAVDLSVPPGSYWLSVVGTSGAVWRSAKIGIVVTSPVASPADSLVLDR